VGDFELTEGFNPQHNVFWKQINLQPPLGIAWGIAAPLFEAFDCDLAGISDKVLSSNTSFSFTPWPH
jgi:hypothetical protein